MNLLPALPKAWPTGSVKGLRARGGFEVAIDWENQRLKSATLLSCLGQKCQMRANVPFAVMLKDQIVQTVAEAPFRVEFETQPRASYALLPPDSAWVDENVK